MYLCENLSPEAVCLSWIPFQDSNAVDYSLLGEAFLSGFGVIFGFWIIGLAVSVTVRLVRLA
jgi:hypothetical protein